MIDSGGVLLTLFAVRVITRGVGARKTHRARGGRQIPRLGKRCVKRHPLLSPNRYSFGFATKRSIAWEQNAGPRHHLLVTISLRFLILCDHEDSENIV